MSAATASTGNGFRLSQKNYSTEQLCDREIRQKILPSIAAMQIKLAKDARTLRKPFHFAKKKIRKPAEQACLAIRLLRRFVIRFAASQEFVAGGLLGLDGGGSEEWLGLR